MKLVVLLLSIVVASSTFASFENECYLKLTDNYHRDSTHFYREVGQNDRDYGKDHLGYSFYIIRNVIKEVGCKRDSINFGKGPRGRSMSRCTKTVSGVISSLTCYVESNVGYFFVTWDQLDNANVVYNRWD